MWSAGFHIANQLYHSPLQLLLYGQRWRSPSRNLAIALDDIEGFRVAHG
jgi:hypothetical protein